MTDRAAKLRRLEDSVRVTPDGKVYINLSGAFEPEDAMAVGYRLVTLGFSAAKDQLSVAGMERRGGQ